MNALRSLALALVLPLALAACGGATAPGSTTSPAPTDPPSDVRGDVASWPGELGAIERTTVPPTNTVRVEHVGPVHELPDVDRALDRALERAWAKRSGPTVRIFAAPPDDSGVATITTVVPVRLSQDPDSGDLPSWARSGFRPATDALVAPYKGPYPRDGALLERLQEEAGKLGLTPAGPLEFAVLSELDEGESRDLRLQVRLPVKAAE